MRLIVLLLPFIAAAFCLALPKAPKHTKVSIPLISTVPYVLDCLYEQSTCNYDIESMERHKFCHGIFHHTLTFKSKNLMPCMKKKCSKPVLELAHFDWWEHYRKFCGKGYWDGLPPHLRRGTLRAWNFLAKDALGIEETDSSTDIVGEKPPVENGLVEKYDVLGQVDRN